VTEISDIAHLVFRLCFRDPKTFGGILIKTSAGPHLATLRDSLRIAGHNPQRLHPTISMPELVGGIDPITSLAEGRLCYQQGMLDRSEIITCVMSERLPKDVAAVIAGAMDDRALSPLILIDESTQQEQGPPDVLTNRIAFCLDLTNVRSVDFAPAIPNTEHPTQTLPYLSEDQISTLIKAALQMGIVDLRPVLMAQRAAQHLAAFDASSSIRQQDLDRAAALVFGHRAQYFEPPEEQAQPPAEDPSQSRNDDASSSTNTPLPQDLMIDAVKAILPSDVLAKLSSKTIASSPTKGMGFGSRQKSNLRGRPKPARPGRPQGQERIDLLASLRSAAPWQKSRRAHRDKKDGIVIYPNDLHIQRFDNRSERVLIFAVDASGSAAMNRMGEAKGAVELMLAQAYAKRDFVALIGFRDVRADVLLHPTRSLVQTKKNLAGLAAGGGTPLALGIDTAVRLATAARSAGKAASIAVLTDGKGNINLNGDADRQSAMEDAYSVARRAHSLNIPTLFIDCGRRTNPDLIKLADEMTGRYISLPRANAHGLSEIVQAHFDQ
jgi:magnesium chelatase subunit D